jgi:uncharacterized membrane-anchored protein
MLSKVPEITVWFWVIKILCTTVGESFADWINMTLGVGLVATAAIFTVLLVVVLFWQIRLDWYVPSVYWLAVVVLSVTGTLYTDILTDSFGVPLAVSCGLFAFLLAVIFGVWFARERTLSIHSITTVPREVFYWAAVLITFALGTAVGDWTLELTGWDPGVSVLLPTAVIAAIAMGWRVGANPVLSFWLAYILTRPLGANIGDWLGLPREQQGLGVGVGVTSVLFLAAILAVVVYLSVSRVDVIGGRAPRAVDTDAARERVMLGYFAVVAVAAATVLVWASAQPHEPAAGADESEPAPVVATLAPGQSASAKFAPAEVAALRTIVEDTLVLVGSGDHLGAVHRINDLETEWDAKQSTLQPLDANGWIILDSQIDQALHAVRSPTPDSSLETRTLTALKEALS